MLMCMLFALFGAQFAGVYAGFELQAQHLDILRRPANSHARRGVTNVGAIEADTDALAHLHILGQTGIGAAGTKEHAQAGMTCCLGEVGVEIITDIRVGLDHPVKGHGLGSFAMGKPQQRMTRQMVFFWVQDVLRPAKGQ